MGLKQWRRKKKDPRWIESTDGGCFNRPPPVPENSYDSVPNWERKFCSQMSWRAFCDKKRVTHIYENVLNWNDSAGKVAFDNAKARYWAEMNGLPCKIPSPDPDMYIDEINYSPPVELQLYEDLYKMPPPPPPKAEIRDLSSITPTGWEMVDPYLTYNNIPEFIFIPPTAPYHSIDNSGDEECFDSINSPTAPNHTADNSAPIVPTGWGDEEGYHSINPSATPNYTSGTALSTGWGDKRDSDSTHAPVLPEIQSKGAFTGNCGNFSSLKHQHKTNARSRGGGVSFRHGNRRWSGQVYETDVSFGSNHANRWHKAGSSSFISKPANQRCNDQVYEMDKYAKEQYFWHHDTSFDRGLSTGFHGGDSTLW
ncbi:hypothetical protein KSP40_PGU013800 [Platanthera guangdongensis]|uniref:Uncharacterized protein n=1 Tax=Platanthera guangdongensis TaxID=2320717 RepID=A0ABR2M6T2_9ASPA